MAKEKLVTVQMVQTKEMEVSPGSKVTYMAGDFYQLPEKQAQEWILEGVCIDPDNPPVVEEPIEEPQTEEGGAE